MIEFKTRNH